MTIKPIPLLAAIGFAIAGSTSLAAEPDRPMIITPVDKAKFVPANPQRPEGSQLSVLRGDPATGPSDMLFLQRRGATPLHSHSSDYHLSLISGAMKHWDSSGSEATAEQLGPGSYWFQPGGEAHVDLCISDECLMFIHWGGKRDSKLEEPAK